MNEPQPNALLREIFRQAVDASSRQETQAMPDEPHLIDDDELLIRWSLDELSDDQHREVLEHLASCGYCRRELAKMIKVGALVLPEGSETEFESNSESIPAPVSTTVAAESSGWRKGVAVAVAIAACLLVAVVWQFSGPGGDQQLALAQRELEEGQPEAAFQRVADYLKATETLEPADRMQATTLLEQSGYAIARGELGSGDFGKVLEIEAKASQYGAASGRIANLQLQAERGQTDEQSLTSRGALTDYEISLEGRPFAKGFPAFDPTVERIQKQLIEAIATYPNTPQLHLNYGQFLLEQDQLESALEQFEIAKDLAPTDHRVYTGKGLAKFAQNTDKAAADALGDFQQAVDLQPEDMATNLNLAICLTRLNRPNEAKPYFEQALAKCKDDILRQGIESVLSE